MASFQTNDLVLLIDRKGRKQLIQLAEGSKLHSHMGIVSHDKIIGSEYGIEIATDKGGIFTIFPPSLSDYILTMKRGAQIIYPKDLGPLLFMADIKPGVKVFESGVGSGALSLALLTSGAKVVGYENRQDHIEVAERNIIDFVGKDLFKTNYEMHCKDSYIEIDHAGFDCVMLDLPEPWQVVPHLKRALEGGGTFMAYTPSISQATQLTETLAEHDFFGTETMEVFNRNWHIVGKSIRPDHRMVGHTGFITSSRKLS